MPVRKQHLLRGDQAGLFSAYSDRAISAPVIVTRNGRDRLVVMPASGDRHARKGGA